MGLDLLWLAMPVLVLALAALLVWGMQQGGEAARLPVAAAEPARVVPAPAAPVRQPDLGDYLSANMIEDRRVLAALWQLDVPDLIVSQWSPAGEEHIRLTAYDQGWLPFHLGEEAALVELEERLFASAEAQGIPPRALLRSAWSFVRARLDGPDIAIQSQFREGHFIHRFFHLDADGKLHAGAMAGPMAEGWLQYRLGVAEYLAGRPAAAYEGLLAGAMSADGRLAGWVEGWLALSMQRRGAEPAAVRTHLAHAAEWNPRGLTMRLARGSIAGAGALQRLARQLHHEVATHSDRRVQTCFLVAQSLVTNGHAGVAAETCRLILREAPRHPATSRLLQSIERRERGAQT